MTADAPQDQPERITQLVASGEITLTDLDLGACWSCDRIAGRPQRRASWWWMTCKGYWIDLCARCCDIWRHGARDGIPFAPLELTSHRPDQNQAA